MVTYTPRIMFPADIPAQLPSHTHTHAHTNAHLEKGFQQCAGIPCISKGNQPPKQKTEDVKRSVISLTCEDLGD